MDRRLFTGNSAIQDVPGSNGRQYLRPASRSCQFVGLIFLVLFLVLPIQAMLISGAKASEFSQWMRMDLAGLLFYGIPTILYLSLAHRVRQRRPWAVLLLLMLTLVELTLFVFSMFLVGLRLSDNFPYTLLSFVLVTAMVGCLSNLAYRLARVYLLGKPDLLAERRGFEPITEISNSSEDKPAK